MADAGSSMEQLRDQTEKDQAHIEQELQLVKFLRNAVKFKDEQVGTASWYLVTII